MSRHVLDIRSDFSVSARKTKPGGPPLRIDGMTVGFVQLHGDPPHRGEVHPDGDEILYMISGRVRVVGESTPNQPVELGPGDACIVPKGEWHLVTMLEPGELIHITPGPNGDYRPL